MFKVMWLMKRKPELTHEQFREHFERSHAPMAQKYVGHLYSEYRRNYMSEVWCGGDPRREGSGYGPREWAWDLVSEWIMPDEAAFNEILRIMESPEIRKEFEEDEDRFIDRSATVMVPCVVADTGTGDGHAAPAWARAGAA
jgi:hypothetical protein